MQLPDRSRFFATLLDYATSCESLEAYRRQVLHDLRAQVESDGALYRPGTHWAQSSTLYLDEGPQFTDIYVQHSARFGPELGRWCELSRGNASFIDSEVYDARAQARMSVYGEIVHPSGIRSILACPLRLGDETVGLSFLFRRGRARPFPHEAALRTSALLSGMALAERLLVAAFAHGRPGRVASRGAPPGDRFETLGARERQVAALVGYGLQAKEIAALLGTSFHTVRAQTQRIYERLGLRGRTQVALYCHELGVVSERDAVDPTLRSFAGLLRRSLSHRFEDAALPPPSAAPGAPLTASAASSIARLSPREREVAKLVARGLTTQQIASALGTSFATVRTQVERVFDKVGVRTRAALACVLAAAGEAPVGAERS